MTGALPPLSLSHHAGGHAERPRFSRSQHHPRLSFRRIRATVRRLDKGEQLSVALNGDASKTIVELPGGEARHIAPALRRQHEELGLIHVARQIVGAQQLPPERIAQQSRRRQILAEHRIGMQS